MSVEWLVRQFTLSRLSPDEVVKNLREGGFTEKDINEARDEFLKLVGTVKRLTPPPMIVDPAQQEEGWYPGADRMAQARFWPALKGYLLDEKRWPAPAVESLHNASDRIVAWLQSPWAARIKTRGLVVGYVQSGKTANFTAVIAKAADAGYRFFIVLSGTKTALRSQTQQRLEAELQRLNTDAWYSPTSISDFKPLGNVNFFLSEKGFILCVIKKNTVILRKLISWLSGASPDVLQRCPFLIIDDEADEASINTARNQDGPDADNVERTTINKRVVDLLNLLPKAAYLGYTATPFANVLIDPRSEQDLYPRDFIVALPKPAGHFGTEEIFGRERLLDDATEEEFKGLDMVREVPKEEVELLKPRPNDPGFVPQVTPSLQNALWYFWLATAARAVRGQGEQHSTMLIHTSQRVAVHAAMRDQVERFRQSTAAELQSPAREGLLAQLEALWVEESGKVRSEDFEASPVSFQELAPRLTDIVNRCQVVVDNSASAYRLSFDGSGKIQIAIGGNTLSRGLTLEGLVVSFFVRAASTYDTLLQMGRWFGYRPGYADLPRMWMTDELKYYFFDLATIEAEIRRDIDRYAELGITPINFGVRIRTNPALEITAPLKMQHAVQAEVSYGRQVIQTVLFKQRDAAWLAANIQETDGLINNLRGRSIPYDRLNAHWIFRGAPADIVLEFLRRYQFHPSSRVASTATITGYIVDQNKNGRLNEWNIAVRGVTARDQGERDSILLGGLAAPLLVRAKRSTADLDSAHIGVLMSKGDIGLDLALDAGELNTSDFNALMNKRQERLPGTGLLVIYPIAKDSEPGRGSKGKIPLDAADNMIGLGLVFPEAVGGSRGAQNYVTVDPSRLRPADWEYDEEEAEEK